MQRDDVPSAASTPGEVVSTLRACQSAAFELAAALARAETALLTTIEHGSILSPVRISDGRKRPKGRVDNDTELRDFILSRITRMTFKEVVAEVALTFPPHRHVSCSSLHRWWHRRGKFLATSTAKS